MKWKNYLPIIGVALFIYILIKVNIYNIFREISNANIFFIFLSLIFVLIGLFTQTLKWFVIAKKQKMNLNFKEAFKINFVSNFYGFITPSKIGTIIRVEYLKKYTGNIGKGLCNFILDKILDTASVIFIAILFSYIFKNKFEIPLGIFTSLLFGFILITLFFINKDRSKFFLKIFFRRFVPERMENKARLTFDSFYENIPRKRYFLQFFLLNLINWIVIYFVMYIIALSLNINVPFIYFLAILPIGTLVSMIPISISGLGTREVVLISLFKIFEVSATKVVSMSILTLLITTIIPAIIASFLIFRKNID